MWSAESRVYEYLFRIIRKTSWITSRLHPYFKTWGYLRPFHPQQSQSEVRVIMKYHENRVDDVILMQQNVIQFGKPQVEPWGLPRQLALSRLVLKVRGQKLADAHFNIVQLCLLAQRYPNFTLSNWSRAAHLPSSTTPILGDDPPWVLVMKSSPHQIALELLGLVHEGHIGSPSLFRIWVWFFCFKVGRVFCHPTLSVAIVPRDQSRPVAGPWCAGRHSRTRRVVDRQAAGRREQWWLRKQSCSIKVQKKAHLQIVQIHSD